MHTESWSRRTRQQRVAPSNGVDKGDNQNECVYVPETAKHNVMVFLKLRSSGTVRVIRAYQKQ